jgi:choice-of-anchor B domain-containing protein
MRSSSSLLAPAGVLGLVALLLSSACSPQVAGKREAVAGRPKPTSAPTFPAGVVPADWTPAMPLKGGVFKCGADGKIAAFECHNVELLAYLPKDSVGKSTGADLWGWHDSTTGREFLLIGGMGATAFVEVTDPINPKYLGVLRPPSGMVASVKVYKHYALIGYESANHGMQVFDLTQLLDVKNAPVKFQETVHYPEYRNTHTITMNQETGFAYVNGSNTCGGGLHMIDMRTPTKPTHVGCYPETLGKRKRGYIHDAQCVIYRGPDRQYKGREICVNYAEAGIGIVDVTDKKQPKTISTFSYPNVGYTHQGWFTEDQRYIFVNDEDDERNGRRNNIRANTRTLGFDLTDLDDPVILTEFFNPKTTITDHNLYIRGRYMYQGNYGAGLRIIDVADPKNLKEVGYLTDIGSTFGPYPFFKNDVVAVSTGKGLILARLQMR